MTKEFKKYLDKQKELKEAGKELEKKEKEHSSVIVDGLAGTFESQEEFLKAMEKADKEEKQHTELEVEEEYEAFVNDLEQKEADVEIERVIKQAKKDGDADQFGEESK